MKSSQILLLWFVLCFGATGCSRRLPVVDYGNWVKMENGEILEGYHRRNDSIFIEDYDFRHNHKLIYMDGVDLNSFLVCKESGGYAKDSLHVYHLNSRYVITKEPEFFWDVVTEYIIDADTATFKYIGCCIGADKKQMYWGGEKCKWDNMIIKTKGMRSSWWVELPEESMDDKRDTVP